MNILDAIFDAGNRVQIMEVMDEIFMSGRRYEAADFQRLYSETLLSADEGYEELQKTVEIYKADLEVDGE